MCPLVHVLFFSNTQKNTNTQTLLLFDTPTHAYLSFGKLQIKAHSTFCIFFTEIPGGETKKKKNGGVSLCVIANHLPFFSTLGLSSMMGGGGDTKNTIHLEGKKNHHEAELENEQRTGQTKRHVIQQVCSFLLARKMTNKPVISIVGLLFCADSRCTLRHKCGWPISDYGYRRSKSFFLATVCGLVSAKSGSLFSSIYLGHESGNKTWELFKGD